MKPLDEHREDEMETKLHQVFDETEIKRRADAYPKLVQALRQSLIHDRYGMFREQARRALLRELGEDA